MQEFNFNEHPHRRFNPLLNEWVLVSPHRAKRPWQGQNESVFSDELPEFDLSCYLCPENIRANGIKNPQYDNCYVFDNDFAAIITNDVPTASFIGNLDKRTKAGIIKNPPPAPTNPVTIPTIAPSNRITG